jgi:hypothetical protein
VTGCPLNSADSLRAILREDDTEGPILSIVDLFDMFLVIIAMLMIIIVQNPLNPFASKTVVGVENPGRGEHERSANRRCSHR